MPGLMLQCTSQKRLAATPLPELVAKPGVGSGKQRIAPEREVVQPAPSCQLRGVAATVWL